MKARAAAPCGCFFRLIFMDLNMPLMDGRTAARKIKARVRKGRLPDVPIVALAGVDLTDGELSADPNFDMFRSKPITKADFLSILAGACLL